MLDLSSTSSNPLNTDLKLETQPLYRIETEHNFFTPDITTISKIQPEQRPNIVTIAEIQWSSWGGNYVTFKGRSMHVDDYLRKKGVFSGSRVFTVASGRTYSWKENVMTNVPGKQVVARWHHKSVGIRGPAHSAYLNVALDAVDDLDEIVMTMVCMQRMIQERARRSRSQHSSLLTSQAGSQATTQAAIRSSF
ncbi:hypothetical protein BDW22DRAFT_1431480 [Trametopsis cervina]|nr:hypothetical protein BDW22DRAFT_1431480 [Trametopsis cervina]